MKVSGPLNRPLAIDVLKKTASMYGRAENEDGSIAGVGVARR
jgi:hypothetical protein